MSAAVVGDKAVFAGGCVGPYGDFSSDAVDIYCSTSDQWTTAQLSKARAGIAATTVGGKAIFAGGYDYSLGTTEKVPQDTVDIYNEATGLWTRAALSVARYGICPVTVGDLVIFAGGRSPYQYFSVADIYNSRTGEWSTAPLSIARSDMVSARVGHTVLFAGADYSVNAAAVDIFDADTGIWSNSILPSPGRLYMAGASVGTKAFFAGGDVGASFSDAVDIYDVSTHTWSTAALSQARTGITAATTGDQAIFVSGWNGFTNVDIYDDDADKWTSEQLSAVRTYPSAVVVGDLAIFGGGWDASEPSAAVDIYNSATSQWSADSLSVPRCDVSAVTVGSRAIFAGGNLAAFGISYCNAVDIFMVPEPSTLVLLGIGAATMLAYVWRRHRRTR